MLSAHIDFETRSRVDLKKVGAWAYAMHPSTEIMCLAYSLDGGPVELLTAGEIDTAHLRQHSRTVEALAKLAETQTGDILIIAVQYGMRHRGKSVRRARETFASNEFGLGAFAIGCMALVHPERYVRWEELDTDCAGDEFAPSADGDFSEIGRAHV